MKALLLTAALAMASSIAVSIAHAETPAELEAQAQKAYEERDYTVPGVLRAQDASNLFGKLAGQTTDQDKLAEIRVRQAAACFFVGDAASDTNVRITQFWNGYQLADLAIKHFGINDVSNVSAADLANLMKLPKEQITRIGEALYVRGINLGQWGEAKGVVSSLDRWPELRNSMELMVKIGAKELHEYGAYRTLGRGLFLIPGLLGGDTAKADKYLAATVKGSLAPGQSYSVNGYNNLFYADSLKYSGKDAEAKKLLQDYLKADPNTILPGYAPESKKAQALAIEKLKTW